MLGRSTATFAATSLLVAGGLVAGAPTASAGCTEVGQTYYTFGPKTATWLKTNLSSSYIKGPGSVSLTKGRNWSVSASMTATVSAEAGVVFAKASASLGVTVGASAGGTQSYTYTLNVPQGKTQRLQQYKQAYQFTVTKKRIVNPCTARVLYSSTVVAPVKSNADKYFLYKLVS